MNFTLSTPWLCQLNTPSISASAIFNINIKTVTSAVFSATSFSLSLFTFVRIKFFIQFTILWNGWWIFKNVFLPFTIHLSNIVNDINLWAFICTIKLIVYNLFGEINSARFFSSLFYENWNLLAQFHSLTISISIHRRKISHPFWWGGELERKKGRKIISIYARAQYPAKTYSSILEEYETWIQLN